MIRTFILSIFCAASLFAAPDKKAELRQIYNEHCRKPSDINEHLPVLKDLAAECRSAVEIGIRSMVSSWALLQGLSESGHEGKFYIGIDIAAPPRLSLFKARNLALAKNIGFEFWLANDMTIDIPVVDLLFIDSLHTYCHLTYELEKFSPQVTKYIALHDTSPPWAYVDDEEYTGDYSEYAPWIDRSKRGLWPAVVDFLERHPEWSLLERRTNNHGFTILKRVF